MVKEVLGSPSWGAMKSKHLYTLGPTLPELSKFELHALGYSPYTSTEDTSFCHQTKLQGQLTDNMIHDGQSTSLGQG